MSLQSSGGGGEDATTSTTTTPDTTLKSLSIATKGVTMLKDNLTSGFNYIKDSVYQTEKTENSISMFVMLIIFFLFIGISYYLYDRYVKKMFDAKYVENQEFTDRNTKKQIDFYFFYTNWCPHCKSSKPEWTKFKERIGDRKINNYNVRFFEVDCDKDSKVADKYNVDEYPTIKAISKDGVFEYNAKVESVTLMDFLESITN